MARGTAAGAGGPLTLREGARALAQFVFPGAGSAVSAGVAFAGTWGLGEAAIAYFIEKRPIAEARERLRRQRRETEEERSPASPA